ncbi:hypothetical protein [Lacticaseibacillus hulanensis]|uniref:hypothetical protein n=1 Tax=Lacticaseibacillus hulanensis TaxID=2493111 RepID=UPI000FDAEC9B|nr:hypothetical protein [Lacticaseibacillus hulanensis]
MKSWMITLLLASTLLSGCGNASAAKLRSENSALKAENARLRSASSPSLAATEERDEDSSDAVASAERLTRVGTLDIAVERITNSRVENNPRRYTPVETGYPQVKTWPAEYFRGEIKLRLTNEGSAAIDLTRQVLELTDGQGRTYTAETSDTFGKVIYAREILEPNETATANLYVIGKRRINLDRFALKFGPQFGAKGQIIAEAGATEYQ